MSNVAFSPTVLMGIKTSYGNWHHKVFSYLICSQLLPLSSNNMNNFSCDFFFCNKNTQISLDILSLKSHGLFDSGYTYVWESTLTTLIDDFRYYIIFIYHLMKYI